CQSKTLLMDAGLFISSQSINLKNLPMPGETCPHCNVAGNIVGQVSFDYIAFFGIPVFPTGTTRMAVCTNCKKLYGMLNMPHELKQKLHEETKDVKMKNKWRYFFGLILVAVVILFFIIYNSLQ